MAGNNEASGTDTFYLDTKNMDTVIGQLQNLAKTSQDLKADFQETITHTTEGWSGQGRKEFDKKAHMLLQQLTDVSQSCFDIAEKLLGASEAYMEADTQLAKTLDGRTDRY